MHACMHACIHKLYLFSNWLSLDLPQNHESKISRALTDRKKGIQPLKEKLGTYGKTILVLLKGKDVVQ